MRKTSKGKKRELTAVNHENRLGKLVRERRTEMELSQAVVAKRTGVSVAEICRIELGERANPSMAVMVGLGKALDLTEEEFMDLVGYENESESEDDTKETQ